jgi:hypothetical protein
MDATICRHTATTPAPAFTGTSKNLIFVAMLRCLRKFSPYISNICGVEIFHSRLAWMVEGLAFRVPQDSSAL